MASLSSSSSSSSSSVASLLHKIVDQHGTLIAIGAACLAVMISVFAFFEQRKNMKAKEKQKIVAKLINEADPIMKISSMELAKLLRERKVTAVDIVEKYIQHIEKINPHINAIVGTRFEEARKEAEEADKLLDAAKKRKAVDLPPLLGVPLISKEVHEYPGLPYTSGLVKRKDVVGEKVCPALKRIVDEGGAIILGAGNTSESCMWAESHNLVHGQTNNPFDITRSAGGSSGGNGSALSALCSSFSITSDVGGSTRIPALYQGLFGHKASGGSIPNTRTIPQVHGIVEAYCQIGPSCRSAEDLYPILEIISGPLNIEEELHDADEEELVHAQRQLPFMKEFPWIHPKNVNPRKLRYFVIWEQPGAQMGLVSARHPEQLQAQKKVVQSLEEELSIQVESIKMEKFKLAFDIWSAMLGKANEDYPFAGVISEGKPEINVLFELIKYFAGASDHTLPALGLAMAEKFAKLTPKRNEAMINLGKELEAEINELLGPDGVLIMPGLPTPAPKHGPLPNLLYFADFGACGIFNTLQLPATAVPVGLSSDEGLPLGVQLVGGHGFDHNTIAVSCFLEKVGTAGWNAPRMNH